MDRRIVSIAAAPGWNARFVDSDDPESSRVVTLVSWALVEESGGGTEIVGIVQRAATAEEPSGRLGYADDVEGFAGYAFAGLVTRTSEP